MSVRYKTGATPSTPEEKEEFAAKARKQILDDVNPILAELAQRHEVVTVVAVKMTPTGGHLDLRFPDLDTGDFLCQIEFKLPIVRTGNRWTRNSDGGTVHTGAIHYKTMVGPSNRYMQGNYKAWTTARLPEIREYLEQFITVGKLFHKQRRQAVTLVPRLKAALERRSVPAGCTAEVTVEAGTKGLVRTIERMLRHRDYYTKETYLYNEAENTLVLNSTTSSGILCTPFSV